MTITQRAIFLFMAVWLLAVSTISCGGGGGGNDQDTSTETGDIADTMDDGDTTSDSDLTMDTQPEEDATADPDAGEDPSLDTIPDTTPDTPDELDCEPGTTGNPPSPITEACGKAASCIATDSISETAWECMLMSLFNDWQPIYGTWQELLLAGFASTLWGNVHANSDCLDDALGCDEVFECLNDDLESPECDMSTIDFAVWPIGCAAGSTQYCVQTDPGLDVGRTVTVPCPAGQSCQSLTGVFAGCFYPDCTTTDPEPVCRDGNIDRCLFSGVHAVYDCDELSMGTGGTCEMVDDGAGNLVATCVPPGGDCDPSSFTPYCTADMVTRCAAGHEYDSDCSTIASDWFCNSTTGECAPDMSGWSCTVGTAGTCDCTDTMICDPLVGQDVRIHCPEFGLRMCDDSSGGAICVP